MPSAFQALTLSHIDSSPEIATWLSQFQSPEDRLTAKHMLLRLRFVSSDRFSVWLKHALDEFSVEEKHAIFTVRKLLCPRDGKQVYFDEQGCAPSRPSGSQGSEDLVNSVIANHLKNIALSQVFFDHPSIHFYNSRVITDLEEFKKVSCVIVANRVVDELASVANKVYTRDLFGND